MTALTAARLADLRVCGFNRARLDAAVLDAAGLYFLGLDFETGARVAALRWQ